MRLYLMRHGDAPFDLAAGERILSVAGVEDTIRIVGNRAKELNQLSHIVCSPSRRARETLAVVQNVLDLSAELIFDDCLRTDGTVSRVETFIDKLPTPPAAILLLSHQPLVGFIYRYLLDQPYDNTFLSTASLAAFEMPAFGRGCGELQWMDMP